jgi:hypothetical protein
MSSSYPTLKSHQEEEDDDSSKQEKDDNEWQSEG